MRAAPWNRGRLASSANIRKLLVPFGIYIEYSFSFQEQFKTADIAPLAFSNFTVSSQDIGNKLFDLLPLGI